MTRLASRYVPYIRPSTRNGNRVQQAEEAPKVVRPLPAVPAVPGKPESIISQQDRPGSTLQENERVCFILWYPENISRHDVLERIASSISPKAREYTKLYAKRASRSFVTVPISVTYVLIETLARFKSQFINKPIFLSHGNGDHTVLKAFRVNNHRVAKRLVWEVPYNFQRRSEEEWTGTVLEKMMRRAALSPDHSQYYFAQNGEPVLVIVNYYFNDVVFERDMQKNKTFQVFGCSESRPSRRLPDTNFPLNSMPSQQEQLINELDQMASDHPSVNPLELEDLLFNQPESMGYSSNTRPLEDGQVGDMDQDMDQNLMDQQNPEMIALQPVSDPRIISRDNQKNMDDDDEEDGDYLPDPREFQNDDDDVVDDDGAI
jgi:hypothetical protein